MVKFRECILNITPYVPGKPVEEVQRELGLQNVIKLASNESPLGPSKKAIEVMQRVAADGISMYPDGSHYCLKKVLAKHLGVGENNLIIGNGTDEILKLIEETYIYPDDEIIMADPSFSGYLLGTQLMGGKVVKVPLDQNYTHNLDAMLEAITERTKIIFICNPNNPTGTIIVKGQLDRFLDAVPEDILVVIDEAYYEYVENKEYPNSIEYIKEGKNVMVTRTFSKIYGLGGLRIGYGIANENIISLINRARMPFNVNTMAQVAAIASIQDSEQVPKSFRVNKEGKEYLYKEFDKMGLFYIPTEANFIFVDIGVNARGVYEALLEKGIIVRTGDNFGKPTFIRVTIGKPEENKRFIQSLKEILG
ncbi:MAG: histidinol-phosphate transaminase [Bacillota bacterium]|jgi:histidinol-phosphate aminotransferase